ncbi:deoxyuridine 5-triphosphate nucleotidohydrolase [Nannochloropsis oceanica]
MSLSRPTEVMQVKRLSQHAVLPVRGSEWAAGYDLASAEDTVVPAGGKALVKTDLSIAIPENTYARIAPRSGLAWKKHIDVGAGVVDYDYRGPVGVVLFNHGQEDFPVVKGDRVAQLILEKICMARVEEVTELSETKRGAGGFGSTGMQGQQAQQQQKGEQEGKRMKVEEVEVPGQKGAQLLVMLKEVAEAFPSEEAWAKSLKPLALVEDSRLYAAWSAYQVTKDLKDLKETLRLITPAEQPAAAVTSAPTKPAPASVPPLVRTAAAATAAAATTVADEATATAEKDIYWNKVTDNFRSATTKRPSTFFNDDEEEEEENDDDLGAATASVTLALAKAVGKLSGLDIAKEIYLALLSRQHPFPFCAWQVIFDPRLFTPVLLDTNSVYWLQALHFRTRNDVFRITGTFPLVRYFSFQSYDSAGKPLSSLPDYQLQPQSSGGINPFVTLSSSFHINNTSGSSSSSDCLGQFEIYVTADGKHGYPNELAALRDPSLFISTSTILYRLYGVDPSVLEEGERGERDGGENEEVRTRHRWELWGFVEPPVVERMVVGKRKRKKRGREGGGRKEDMIMGMEGEEDGGPTRAVMTATGATATSVSPSLSSSSSPSSFSPSSSPSMSSPFPSFTSTMTSTTLSSFALPSLPPSSWEEWELLPPCSQLDLLRVAQEFRTAEKKYLFPLPAQDEVCGLFEKAGAGREEGRVVPSMFPYGHLESRGVHDYVVYTNKDSNYLYWCDATHRMGDGDADKFVVVLRGRLPITPTGLFVGEGEEGKEGGPRIADVGEYEARYVSVSTVENMAPSDTYQSVYDAELKRYFLKFAVGAGREEGREAGGGGWDRRYTIVAAINESVLYSCGNGQLPYFLQSSSSSSFSFSSSSSSSSTSSSQDQGKQGQQQEHKQQHPSTSSSFLSSSFSSIPYYFLPFARHGLTPPRLPGLVYREILARYRVTGQADFSAAYLQKVCEDEGGKTAGKGGKEGGICDVAETLVEVSDRVMGEYYPQIEVYACVGQDEMEKGQEEEQEEREEGKVEVEEEEGRVMRPRRGSGGQWRRLN